MSCRKGTRSLHGAGKRPVRSKKVTRQKQDWVSTVHDLTVHQATPDELSRRHEIHRSKHQAVAARELRGRALKACDRSQTCSYTPYSSSKEVSSEQYQLQHVLARSDRVMAMVKDLFRDAPPRHTGIPHVTMAPDHNPTSERVSLQKGEPADELSVVSQCVMGSQALNELEDESDCCGQEPSSHNISSKCSVLDQCRGRPSTPDPQVLSSCPQNPSVSEGQQAALNATPMVEQAHFKTTLCKVDPPSALLSHVLNPDPVTSKPVTSGRRCEDSRLNSSDFSSLSGGCSSLEVLQSKLREVEQELDTLGPAGAQRLSAGQQGGATLTSFSMALVFNLGRLAHHLRQTSEEVQREVKERRCLEDQVREQQQLIDALTAESLLLREDSTALQQRVEDLEQRLDALVLAVGGLVPEAEHRAADVPVARGPFQQYHVLSSERYPGAQDAEECESKTSSSSFANLPHLGSAHIPASKLPQKSSQQNLLGQSVLLGTHAAVTNRTAQCIAQGAHSVEEQLQELNKRSAAARSRLLSLIEEQRQAVGNSISLCISSIPSQSKHDFCGPQQ